MQYHFVVTTKRVYALCYLKMVFGVVYTEKAAQRFEDERSVVRMQHKDQMLVSKAVVSKGNVKGVTASRFPRHAVALVCTLLPAACFWECLL
jgi:hypothetical protein